MTVATEELRKLVNDATPGPWMVAGVRGKLDRQSVHNVFRYDAEKKRDEQIAAVWYDVVTGLGRADAAIIALTPTLAAELITARAKLEAADNLAKAVDDWLDEVGTELALAKALAAYQEVRQ